MRNIVGPFVKGADFFERPREVGILWNAIKSGKNLLVSGPRRSGKTSLLLHLNENSEENARFLHIFVDSLNSERDFYKTISKKILENNLASRFHLHLERDEYSEFPRPISSSTSLPGADNYYLQEKNKKPEAKDLLIADLNSVKNDHRLLIVLDNFSDMVLNILHEVGESEAARFLNNCKEIRKNAPDNIQFIYVGSPTLEYWVNKLDLPGLFNDLAIIYLTPLSKPEAKQFLKALQKKSKHQLNNEQIEHLLDMIQWLIPSHIQWFLKQFYSIPSIKTLTLIENRAFKTTLSRISVNSLIFFEYLIDNLESTFDRQERGFVNHLLDNVTARKGIPHEEIEAIAVKYGVQDHFSIIIQYLAYEGFIEYDPDSDAYCFNSNLIKTWWSNKREISANGGGDESIKKRSHAPVVLHSLELKNLRAVETLEIRFPSRRRTRGQWTIFLGDNGVGKTTVLQAIAIASLAERQQKAALAGSMPAPLMRHGAEWTSIDLRCGEHGYSVKLYRRDGTAEQIDGKARDDAPPYPIFGYGCGRGSALGGPDRAVELERRIDGVGTLFGLPSFLIHGETWLRSLEHAALKGASEDDNEFFEAVRNTVLNLLPGLDEMEIGRDRIWLRGPDIGESTLAGLSDGYITTLGWSLDLIARWSHEARRSGVQLDGSFNKEMTGLVLIDELDLHLHPRWQTHVIADIRKAFPKMSFVVTTHNPLTLLSANAREVHVMERDEKGGILCNQVDPPPGIRADQVLTGPWFGLSSTLDRDTLRLLDKHRRMLRKGVHRNAPDRKALERKIKERLGSYADTSEERLALDAAARMTKWDKPLDHGERARLQRRVKEMLEVKR